MEELNLHYSQSDSIRISTKNAAILWANGSWKSSLSKKLVSLNSNIHFIGAQRNLTFQQWSLRGTNNKELENSLLGYDIKWVGKLQYNNLSDYIGRHDVNTNNAIQDDFNENIEKLHRDDNYTHSYSSRTHQQWTSFQKPITKADIVFNIWNETFLGKKMAINMNWDIKISTLSWESYMVENLSDWERSALYLIIKCIHAPDNDIILVDEWESHLNQALLHELRNNIEKMRQDCRFIYISHDIDFITSRSDCAKFWIKDFTYPNSREIEEIKWDNLPEELILKIIGVKKDKILFVESKEAKDHILYQRIYLDYKIIPVWSCELVIKYTESFNSINHTYNKTYYWLIDRDFRGKEQVSSLQSRKVFCLPVAEFENIFFREEIIKFLFDDLWRGVEFNRHFELISSAIFALKNNPTFKKDFYKNYITQEFNRNLWNFALEDHYKFEDDYSQADILWNHLYAESDYSRLLLLLNAKWIKGTVGKLWFDNRKSYYDSIINIFNTDRWEKLRTIFLTFMPSIS